LLSKGDIIELDDLPFNQAPPPAMNNNDFHIPTGMSLEDIERRVIYETLRRNNGNKQATANALGIYRPRLYSKIKKYNLTEFM